MRAHIKNDILELVESIFEIHDFLSADLAKYTEFSQLCISAVQGIQKNLDGNNHTIALQMSNEYISAVYDINKKPTKDVSDIISLKNIANKFLQEIKLIETTKHVVFFPYNASMWDSLESIYLACKQDKNCECFVVPIPYYKFDASTNQWNMVYEGELFPEEIPITSYSLYSLEKNSPDIAYIHNPYDEYNYVTRVHENYFSYNLKKHVDLLVYVPYYVNNGHGAANNKLDLPSYNYIDYIIMQSDKDCEMFSSTPYKNKVFALGSPKFDRVSKLKDDYKMPDEWKEIINGRKTLMLNSTIATILTWRQASLKKIKYLFDYVKKAEVALIWRPHPLLQSTIDSMLPHLKEEYNNLLNYFVTSNIGILDTTPNITNTIALSDGYIGCESSVASLFRAAGKPIFLLFYDDNNLKSNNFRTGILCEHNNSYIFPLEFNTAYVQTNKNLEYEKLIWVENQDLIHSCGYNSLIDDNENLYTSYLQSDNILSYNLSTEQVQNETVADISLYGFVQIIKQQNKFICIPQLENHILIYNTKTGKYKKITKAIEDFKKDRDNTIYNSPTVAFTQKSGNILYMGSYDTGNILQFNIHTNEHKVIKVAESGFSSGFLDNGVLWLAQVTTGNVISYNTVNKKTCVYKMPENLKVIEKTYDKHIVHRCIFKKGDTLITLPWSAHSMVKIDIGTSKAELFNENLFTEKFSENSTMPMTGFASITQDGTIILQRMSDFQQFAINVEQDTLKEFEIEIPKQDLERLKNNHIKYVRKHCYIREGDFFTAKEFIADFAKEDYKFSETAKSQKYFANNLDGTCGEKIHALILEKLNKQT